MPHATAATDWRSAAWTATFEEAAACQRLDDELEKLCWNLRRHATSLERTLRARVLRWISKLESEKDSPALVWKRGRNAHARALLAGLRCGRLPPPFDAGPPSGQPLGAALPVACAAAVGLNAAGERPKPSSRWRNGAGGGEDWSMVRMGCSSRGVEVEGDERRRGGRKRPVVAGTALPLAPPLSDVPTGSTFDGRRRRGEKDDSTETSDPFSTSHLPSRVELAASLGAATERIAELEWRLGEKERRSRAREWEASVAAARAASALLGPSPSPSEEEEKEGKERRKTSPFLPLRRALRTPKADTSRRREGVLAVPFLAPSPKATAAAATATPLLRAKPKVAAASTPPQQQQPSISVRRKLKMPEHQQQKIPTISLEEISRRIAALKPQRSV